MRSKEFIKQVEDLGYRVNYEKLYFYIRDADDSILAIVNKSSFLDLSTDYIGWDLLSEEEKSELFAVLYDFAATPPDEREEEKRYWLKHSWLGRSDWRYLNILEDGYFFLREGDLIPTLKNTFTLKQIEEIKEKYNTDLSDFDIVEVEE